MKHLSVLLLCLLLLSGCTSVLTPMEKTAESPTSALTAFTDATLTIGRRLTLPVTENSLREDYQSFDGFYRYVLDIRKSNGNFLIWSVPMPYTDTGELPDEDTRFDWVYGETGYCYVLLEGRYTMDEILSIGQGSITLHANGEQGDPVTISAGLDRSLINIDTGDPVQQDELYCVSKVRVFPQEIPLQDSNLFTLPGTSTTASLEAVYLDADSLELVFDTSEQVAFSQVEISYDSSLGELSLTCLDTALLCAASGSNLYVEGIRAEQHGSNTAVVCSLGTPSPEEPWMHSAHANAIQVETEFLPGYDWGKGVLRLTFWPFMG